MPGTGYSERSKPILNKITFLILLVLWFIPARPADSQWKLEEPLDSLVCSGIDLILKQDYDKADSLFRDVAMEFPQHPAGYLYQAAVKQAYMADWTVQIDENQFDSLLAVGRAKAELLQWPWREYFLATADGYQAYERAESGDWFGGVRKGYGSAGEFEQIVERDSTFTDAYIGIGTYYYWRSRKTEFLQWLPFVRDDREKGIYLIEEGARRSRYNRLAAVSALVSIFLDAERYDEVLKWSELGLASYPENRIYLWGKATALDRQKQTSEAVTAYLHLLANILVSSAPHPYDEIVCRLNLAQCQLVLQDTAQAKQNLELILIKKGAAFPKQLADRARDKFSRAKDMLVQLRNGGRK